MEESTFTIPIGPQHPFLKEPAKFDFDIQGEEIVGARMNIGYNHRGIEKACEARNYYQCIYLLERICGICSHSHTTAFVQAVEEIMNLEVPRRGLYLRTLVCELERLHSHLLWLGVAAHEVGFDSLFMLVWRDREIVMDILEEIGGNRVNYAINTIGGVRRDITDEQRKKILDMLGVLQEAAGLLYQNRNQRTQLCRTHSRASGRCRPNGRPKCARSVLLPAPAPSIPTSGATIRMLRIKNSSLRSSQTIRVTFLAESSCAFSRWWNRCKMIEQLLTNLPEGDIVAPKVPRKAPAGVAVSRYEAPRGEDVHFVRGNGTDKPERVRVRAPTMANLEAATESVIGAYRCRYPDRNRFDRSMFFVYGPDGDRSSRPQERVRG